METVLGDVKYAVCMLARTPGFTLVVVLTLALAIGANSAVFSAIDAILWRPLGFPDADRLVVVNPSIPTAPISNTAPALAFLVRARGDPGSVVNVVRAKLKELEPLRAVYDISALPERIGAAHADERLRTSALALFAGTALALACLGVYGTLSYVVGLRRREVGLRVALGAQQSNIVAQFLSLALRVVAAACGVGLALSLAFSRALSGMLFGVSPFDAVTLVSVIALAASVAIVAALVPAVRAARVAPMTVLRDD